MAYNVFVEGVKPGGLTTTREIRILLCYLLCNVPRPVTRQQLDEVLIGEELANYFAMADSLNQLIEQQLVQLLPDGYAITESGRTVGQTLAEDVPRTIRDAAVRGVIRAQQYAAKAAAYKTEVLPGPSGKGQLVRCAINDETGALFSMEIYMPDELSAKEVSSAFTQHGDAVYKLLLAALTKEDGLAKEALDTLRSKKD